MIEVEKKFLLKEDQKKALIEGAFFVSSEDFVDVYYDTKTHDGMKRGLFLRKRNEKFELKETITLGSVRKEITDEAEIRAILQLPKDVSLEKGLEAKGIVPLYPIRTRRQKFTKEGFTIDMDEAFFPNKERYTLCEIELMVETSKEIPHALKLIESFAKKVGLSSEPVRGKMYEYLHRIGINL